MNRAPCQMQVAWPRFWIQAGFQGHASSLACQRRTVAPTAGAQGSWRSQGSTELAAASFWTELNRVRIANDLGGQLGGWIDLFLNLGDHNFLTLITSNRARRQDTGMHQPNVAQRTFHRTARVHGTCLPTPLCAQLGHSQTVHSIGQRTRPAPEKTLPALCCLANAAASSTLDRRPVREPSRANPTTSGIHYWMRRSSSCGVLGSHDTRKSMRGASMVRGSM